MQNQIIKQSPITIVMRNKLKLNSQRRRAELTPEEKKEKRFLLRVSNGHKLHLYPSVRTTYRAWANSSIFFPVFHA